MEDNPGGTRLAKEMFQEAEPRLDLNIAEDGVQAIGYLKSVCRGP